MNKCMLVDVWMDRQWLALDSITEAGPGVFGGSQRQSFGGCRATGHGISAAAGKLGRVMQSWGGSDVMKKMGGIVGVGRVSGGRVSGE